MLHCVVVFFNFETLMEVNVSVHCCHSGGWIFGHTYFTIISILWKYTYVAGEGCSYSRPTKGLLPYWWWQLYLQLELKKTWKIFFLPHYKWRMAPICFAALLQITHLSLVVELLTIILFSVMLNVDVKTLKGLYTKPLTFTSYMNPMPMDPIT